MRLRALLEALAGKATEVGYPRTPSPPPESFRGPPVFNKEACIGCGACVQVCPAEALKLVYVEEDRVYLLEHTIARCIACGYCADVCPEKAITMSREYELATSDPSKLIQRVEHDPSWCSVCGEAYATRRSLERAIVVVGAKDYVFTCPSCRAKRVASTIASARRPRLWL